MRRVHRPAAVDPGVEVPLACSDTNLEERDASRRDLEDRDARREHVPVEDDACVSPTLVRREEVDDRVAAGLLLAVAGEAHVHRQRAVGGKKRGRFEEDVELALVVGDAARIEPAVPHRRLERRALPGLERRRGLDVEVAVGDDRRRLVGALGRADLADHERLISGRLSNSASPPAPRMKSLHPFGSAHDVVAMLGIGTDTRDAEELGELLHPLCGRLRHERRSLGLYATSRSFWQSARARSFFRHWFSICLIRSRVTLNARPTSSSVRGCSPSSP